MNPRRELLPFSTPASVVSSIPASFAFSGKYILHKPESGAGAGWPLSATSALSGTCGATDKPRCPCSSSLTPYFGLQMPLGFGSWVPSAWPLPDFPPEASCPPPSALPESRVLPPSAPFQVVPGEPCLPDIWVWPQRKLPVCVLVPLRQLFFFIPEFLGLCICQNYPGNVLFPALLCIFNQLFL